MIKNPMSEDERQAYALEAIQKAATIAYDPDSAKPPYFNHILKEEIFEDQYAFGPAILALMYPDLAFAVVSFRFESDYIKNLDIKETTLEYLERAGEAELPARTQAFEQQMVEDYPDLLQYSDEEIVQACAQLGIPYALLIFAENQRTEEEVPILYHPPFVKASDALKAIQYLSAQRLDELTR